MNEGAALHFRVGDVVAATGLVETFHYSHRMAGNIQLVGTWHESGGLFGDYGPAIAAVVFSIPPTRWSEPVWELSRLVRRDDAKITLSSLISQTVSFMKRSRPCDLLVSFADNTQGHHGGIYQACSWNYAGKRDRSVDGCIIEGTFVPGRSLNSRYGTRSPEKLKGIVGTHAYCNVGNTFIFMGSGRNEAVAVYRMIPGDVEKVSTREIDTILDGYTEAQLAEVVAECRVDKDQQQVLFHLPDRTLCYGSISSGKVGEPVWWTLDSGVVEPAAYRMRNAVRVYDKWIGGDVLTGKLGVLTNSTAEHFGEVTGWQFGTLIVYAEGNDAIIHELELVALAGRVASGADPVIWTQYSVDGETWSQERSTRAGRAGQRMQRICWRTQGTIHNQRMQRFRGTSDAFLSIARLQASLEALMTRPAYG